ncbi:hypothetical protein [Lacisediminihabitans changchengi]|uniref:Uncharacterized protein n=1 Tax=Lacisediminihabitans changchengi TaxID=2787634 RepID=A0A934W5N2_9MICO|nr:hypothetical protein [Lacisediminihabitans changchengi]MBK4348705.1 hypothetical protein [Lacisediminihabitans changchengi]
MRRRGFTTWIVLGGVLVAAFVVTVTTLNLTLYSANGFVGSYLSALARHDVADALRTPGVTAPRNASRALLRSDAMAELSDIRFVSDSTTSTGAHRVTVSYRLGDTAGRSTFEVRRDGSHLGLFSAWRFAATPVSALHVTVDHAASFVANGLPENPTNGDGTYLVLTPAAITLSHASAYLTAAPTTVLVDDPGVVAPATVEVRASAAFVKAVQKQLDAQLASCVKQTVLQPTGCPMGQQIRDRVQDTPTWSMVKLPVVTIAAAGGIGNWAVPPTEGTAHLKVTVKSIFDGTVSVFDEDVPFSVAYAIMIAGDGSLQITAQY